MLVRDILQVSLQLLAGRTASPATAGLLADALHLLAVGLEDAPHRARQELRTRLLLLFTDVAASVGGGSGIVVSDLGDLLVAVAVAAEGLQPRTVRLLGGSSSNRMSIHDIQVMPQWLQKCKETAFHSNGMQRQLCRIIPGYLLLLRHCAMLSLAKVVTD